MCHHRDRVGCTIAVVIFSLHNILPGLLCVCALAASPGLDDEDTASRGDLSSQPAGVDNNETFSGFSWVRDGKLAGMPRPGGRTDLRSDLAFLHREGLQVLFSLTENSMSSDVAQMYGMQLIHVPVKDFTAPSQHQLLDFIKVTENAMDEGKAVGVHCQGGQGRTGTFLAAWFIHEGMSADEALDEIRKLRPGSVETASQEKSLRDLEIYLRPGEVGVLPNSDGWDGSQAPAIAPTHSSRGSTP